MDGSSFKLGLYVGRVVAIYSGEKGGTGKTTLSLLTTIFADLHGYPVVYLDLSIDMDYLHLLFETIGEFVRRPGRHSYGILDYLLGKCKLRDVLHGIEGRDNIVLIPAGQARPEEVSKIDWKRLCMLVRRIAKVLGAYVIVDMPACRIVDPVNTVLTAADVIAFVAEETSECLSYFAKHVQLLKEYREVENIVLIVNKARTRDETALAKYLKHVNSLVKTWQYVNHVTAQRSLPELILRRYVYYLMTQDDLVIRELEAKMPPGRAYATKHTIQTLTLIKYS